jgi:hypothetical protein
MAVKKTGNGKNAKKNTVNVSVNVETTNFDLTDFDGVLNSVETAQKQNSLYAEFGPEPTIVAITGVALQHRIYGGVPDMAIHLKIVFQNEPDKVRISTIRGFYQKDENGRMLPKGIAYQETIKLVAGAGVKISKIHGVEENPNLGKFGGWTGISEPLVVVIATRESNGRFWPNRISKYAPIKSDVTDLIADVLNMKPEEEGDAQ